MPRSDHHPPCLARSWLADDMIAYLREVEAKLSENRLLERFNRALDDQVGARCLDTGKSPLRQPLSGTVYDDGKPRQETGAEYDIRRRARDFDGLFQGRDRPHASDPPKPLDAIIEGKDRVVILGEPGAGKTEWLKRHVRDVAERSRTSLESMTELPETVAVPLYVTCGQLAMELGEVPRANYLSFNNLVNPHFSQ